MALTPLPSGKTGFAGSSALILFAIFVALLIAAGYLGHMMAE
ncbi:hypothetical protein [Hyphomicrobium sp.]|nr:hypothetical protein [Hyphomicrobium sp.]HEX2839647.1 hypothetical protein [Hyphomicrobium sp.]